ncbi:Oidioi.mRNA.OKI2018_I69.chr1.g286.t1.cds [Oikopleura dioica]|uniref:Oidioi.mRNA.OKI2018_I69.chr1.g286.t1.cds n=1 Tax=Oikopleura dioica TaxID=34765 RepID=A0ABN7SQM1_OIKDI|nr:Oidioi.mRNA.OKI2018_I69.chr1.g286.t1.cds [Oikopleura dioica]
MLQKGTSEKSEKKFFSKNHKVMLSREQETLDYVKEHKLEGLMTQLIELATYHQPTDLRQFIIEQLKLIVEARELGVEPPSLLDVTNFASIFGLIDINNRGKISREEAISSLKKLGIEEELFIGLNQISVDVFVKEAQEAFQKINSNYKRSR